jgi:hypothetical protein
MCNPTPILHNLYKSASLKGKSAGPDRILNEAIKYTIPVMINYEDV